MRYSKPKVFKKPEARTLWRLPVWIVEIDDEWVHFETWEDALKFALQGDEK